MAKTKQVGATAKGKMGTVVAVMRTSPETVQSDYAAVMRLAGFPGTLGNTNRNIIKINLSWREWYPAVSTAPWQLEGVLKEMTAEGYDVADAAIFSGSQNADWQRQAMLLNGIQSAAERSGATVGINEPYPLEGSNIIHLPVMRADALAGLAGAGLSTLEAYEPVSADPSAERSLPDRIAAALAQQKEEAAGVFTIMDCTIAGDGAGPRMIIPYEKNYLLAGSDPVAVDAVAARMMGFDPMGIEYIRIATERGIGEGDISRIQIAGDDISDVNFHFQGGKEQHLPLAEHYLEYYWFPFKGRAHIGRIAESEWGQMLQNYLPEGAELDRQGKSKGPVLAAAGGGAMLAVFGLSRLLSKHPGRKGKSGGRNA